MGAAERTGQRTGKMVQREGVAENMMADCREWVQHREVCREQDKRVQRIVAAENRMQGEVGREQDRRIHKMAAVENRMSGCQEWVQEKSSLITGWEHEENGCSREKMAENRIGGCREQSGKKQRMGAARGKYADHCRGGSR